MLGHRPMPFPGPVPACVSILVTNGLDHSMPHGHITGPTSSAQSFGFHAPPQRSRVARSHGRIYWFHAGPESVMMGVAGNGSL